MNEDKRQLLRYLGHDPVREAEAPERVACAPCVPHQQRAYRSVGSGVPDCRQHEPVVVSEPFLEPAHEAAAEDVDDRLVPLVVAVRRGKGPRPCRPDAEVGECALQIAVVVGAKESDERGDLRRVDI